MELECRTTTDSFDVFCAGKLITFKEYSDVLHLEPKKSKKPFNKQKSS